MARGKGWDRRQWGWILYDWANSAFVLCVVTVIGAQYFLYVFEQEAKSRGELRVGPAVAMDVGGWVLPGEAVWSFIMSAAALFVVLTSPFLGTIADSRRIKKRFLLFYCLVGVVATVALTWPQPWWMVALLILIGAIGFEAGNVFYNAFLPEVAGVGDHDRLSSHGFAAGYIGGVVVLIVCMVLFTPIVLKEPVGSIRFSFLLIGQWWGGFGLLSGWLLHEPRARARTLGLAATTRQAWGELAGTVRHISRYPETVKFLIAFLLYNDGIATLITNVTPFALQNIYLDATLTQKIGTAQLITAIVIVQLIAFPGSLFFGWMAGRAGPKATLLVCLACFIVVVSYGQVVKVVNEFYLMAALGGWVLGGSQAISRSLFASFVPEGKYAEFFSFYALSDRAASMLGPLVYGVLLTLTGNTRAALLSLTFFFVAGGLVLLLVNVEQGRRAVRSA